MRASHPLLILFVGFLIAVYGRSSGDAASTARTTPEKVVHTWQGKDTRPELRETALRGRLVDVTGRAITGTLVRDRLGGAVATSGLDGRFELTVAEGRCLDLVVGGSAARPTASPAADPAPAATPEAAATVGQRFTVLPDGAEVTLVVRPARPWLAAQQPIVRNLHGGKGAIEEARGQVFVTVRETGESVCVDPTGNYQIAVPKRAFHLIARDATGRVAASDQIAAPRDGQRWMPLPTLTLTEGHRAVGRVRTPAGAPVAQAALVLEGEGAPRRLAAADDGRFEVTGLLPGRYTIAALPAEGLVGQTQAFEVGPSLAPADLELSLQAEQPLELTVVDESGAPQIGVFVQVTEAGNTWSAGQTDDLGKVRLRGLAGGEKMFEVFARTASGFASVSVVRFDAAAAKLVIR